MMHQTGNQFDFLFTILLLLSKTIGNSQIILLRFFGSMKFIILIFQSKIIVFYIDKILFVFIKPVINKRKTEFKELQNKKVFKKNFLLESSVNQLKTIDELNYVPRLSENFRVFMIISRIKAVRYNIF